MHHRRVVVALVIVVGSVTACASKGATRGDVLDDFEDQLVEQGLDRDRAACFVERFASELDDDELRAFIERDELSDEDRALIDAADEACREEST